MYAQNTVPEVEPSGRFKYLHDTLPSLNIINPKLTKIKLVAKNAPQSNRRNTTRKTFREMEFYKKNESIPYGANRLKIKEDSVYFDDFNSFTKYTFNDSLIIEFNEDEKVFSTFELKNDTYNVKIGNNIIRIGDNIKILENLYPKSYQYFISHNYDYIEILTAPVNESSARSIWFKFNPVTRLIVEIILFDTSLSCC